jgi:hypothetical protein
MLDNLRDDADGSSYFDDADDELPDFLEEEKVVRPQTDTFAFLKPITDLTPVQRFILVALLFMAVCLIGSMALLVFGRFAIF